ncbi:MAG: DNA replication/repair protein RecF [Muribaculaceae bacterium]
MYLESIAIVNFKNLTESNLQFSPNINCFIGNNGMGKTNVLDAIYYLSFVKSCSNVGDQLVLNHQADYMMLRGAYSRNGEKVEVTMAYQKGRRKTLKRDGKEYKRFSQHIGLLPLVMVSPMDWDLIRGSGEERRRLMDQIISQSNQEYLSHLIRYNKAIENRNSLIKQGYTDPLLYETVEHQLIESGTMLHNTRQQWIERFSPIFMRYYSAIAGGAETVHLELNSHLNQCSMAQVLNENRQRDMVVGYTTHGVHRDDINLLLDMHPMRKVGSQGQCKTYTIALRLAQYDFLKEQSTALPILLLDDIFDKLDAERVERIVKVVSDNQFGQIFITDTNRSHLDNIIKTLNSSYKIFNVESGCCTVIEENS